jgi:predicted transcriptional regulator
MMKRILFSVAAMASAIMPIAAHAAPAATPKQSVCERVIVVLEDGSEVEGMLCYMVGSRT